MQTGLDPNPASNTYWLGDPGNSFKCSGPQFLHLVMGMSHEYVEHCLEHRHCSTNVEAILVTVNALTRPGSKTPVAVLCLPGQTGSVRC